MMESGKVTALRLMASCCPGLENILSGEVRERMGAQTTVGRGKVWFSGDAPSSLALRCADNLYAPVGSAQAGPHKSDLPSLAASLSRLPLRETIAELLPLGVTPNVVHVSASRSGKHRYSRFEAAAAVLPVLCAAAGGVAGGPDNHTCALRLDIEGDSARLYVKFTGADFRFRGGRSFSPAAVRPTIAHALVRLTKPEAADFFIDPFCGSGTILCERAAYPARQIVGGDIDSAAVEVAQKNGCDARVWDALRLPLDAGSVSAAATNPPWGKQIAVADETALYRGAVRELARVCAPGARVALLTDREQGLADACREAGLALRHAAAVSLHGTLAGVYAIII